MTYRYVHCTELPSHIDDNTNYILEPVNYSDSYYYERTDRNIGWLTAEEQNILKNSTVGIAGCGGMGGTLAQILLRLGVGTIKISDNCTFDESNINRQFGARRSTVGESKALCTARDLRAITDDTTIHVYPRGINPDEVNDFLNECDIVCDEIEFWAVGSRILLHTHSRDKNISIFNSNTIGFGTRLFFFTPNSLTMEECLGMTQTEAYELEQKIATNQASQTEIRFVMDAVIKGLVPDLPSYYTGNDHIVRERLFKEGKAPIIATNPPMASGFISNHILLYLLSHLKGTTLTRDIAPPVPMPGYLYFDAALMSAKSYEGKWW